MKLLFNHQVNVCMVKVCVLPALVPIHSRSLQANNAVILRQAALCCLIIASAPEWRARKERQFDGGQGRGSGEDEGQSKEKREN